MNYVINNSMAKHTIQFTLQSGEYIGHAIMKFGGNCRGFEVLSECDLADSGDCIISSDCDLSIDYEEDSFTMELRNSNGETLLIEEYMISSINEYVVGIEIVDFQEE